MVEALAATRAASLLAVRRSCVFSLNSSLRPSPAFRTPNSSRIASRPFSASLRSQSKPRFSYGIAASFIGKGRPFDPDVNVFHFNPYIRVPPVGDKRARGSRTDSGHDAFFVSRVGDTGSVAFGVADGVGGWVESGVDPADFSHSFCDYMARSAYLYSPGSSLPSSVPGAKMEPMPLSARILMQQGYDAVCRDKSIHAGGSTACVAIASPEGALNVANLGDSGFVALRANAVHAYSTPQTHAFNTPFQLSVVPPSVIWRAAAFGSPPLVDLPQDADTVDLELQHGDVLVFGSDGVWDNLFNHDILRVVSRLMTTVGAWRDTSAGIRVANNLDAFTGVELLNEEAAARTEAEARRQRRSRKPSRPSTGNGRLRTLQSALAIEITAVAKSASLNARVDGPFAKSVKQYYPDEDWHGGKVDDICVVVVVVSERPADGVVEG